MRVTETRDRHARVQVQISVAIEIRERRPVPAGNCQFGKQGNRLQSRRDELVFFIEERFGARLRTRLNFTLHGHAL